MQLRYWSLERPRSERRLYYKPLVGGFNSFTGVPKRNGGA